jgi:DNA-binding transcriptional LysR family regulator
MALGKFRRRVLTEAGQLVFRYADEIFSLGRELSEALQGKPSRERLRLLAGGADAVPKLIAYRVLEPALHLPEPVQLMCDERGLVELLTELAEHRLDLVLSDLPLHPPSATRAYNHLLGECSVCIGVSPCRKKRSAPNVAEILASGAAQARCMFSAVPSSPSADFTEGDLPTPRANATACGTPAGLRQPLAAWYATTGVSQNCRRACSAMPSIWARIRANSS